MKNSHSSHQAHYLQDIVSHSKNQHQTQHHTPSQSALPPIDQQALHTLGFQLQHTIELPWHIEKYQLKNGLTILYHPCFTHKMVSIQTWFGVGSGHETKGKTGLAHLFEHLMFKDTLHHAEGEFDRHIEIMGGEINACTWLDWTCYESDAPQTAWQDILHFEADRLQHLHLHHQCLEDERKVVMNERRETVDDDSTALLDEFLYALSFPKDHPYAHACIGAMQDIQQLSLDDCLNFYKSYYAVNRCTLVICGSIERMPLLHHIHQLYAHIPMDHSEIFIPTTPLSNHESYIQDPHPTSNPTSMTFYNSNTPVYPNHYYNQVTEAVPHTPSLYFIDVDTQCLHIHIAWYGFSLLDEDYVALSCLDELWVQGESACLYQALVLKKAWVSEIYTALPSSRLAGLYEMTLHVNHTDIDLLHILEHINQQLHRIITEGISDIDLQRIKNQKKLYSHLNTRSLKQKATHLGMWHSIAQDCTYGWTIEQAYQQVTATHIQAVCRKLLESTRKTVVIAPHRIENHTN